LDEHLPVDWALPGDQSLHSVLEECRESGDLMEIVLRSAPGWNEPWSRAIRWLRPESLHVTLRFLGEVERETLRRIEASVREVTSARAAFDLEVGDLAIFPSQRRPRAVAALVEGGDALQSLADGIEAAVVDRGLRVERHPFRAHITLGRVRRGTTRVPSLEPSPARVGMRADAVTLYRSRLEPSGAIYSELARLELGG
jgi:2'-5' RNA ligase